YSAGCPSRCIRVDGAGNLGDRVLRYLRRRDLNLQEGKYMGPDILHCDTGRVGSRGNYAVESRSAQFSDAWFTPRSASRDRSTGGTQTQKFSTGAPHQDAYEAVECGR